MNDKLPRYRVNHRAFNQYLTRELKDRKCSERRFAATAGVSHTLLQQIRKGVDSAGNRKKYVTFETARSLESALDAPRNIIFLPELVAA